MRLELSHATIGRLLDGQEITVDGVLVTAHESRDAAYVANATVAEPKAKTVGARRRQAANRVKGQDRDPYMREALFNGKCAACGEAVEKGERIKYAPRTKEVWHERCAD